MKYYVTFSLNPMAGLVVGPDDWTTPVTVGFKFVTVANPIETETDVREVRQEIAGQQGLEVDSITILDWKLMKEEVT